MPESDSSLQYIGSFTLHLYTAPPLFRCEVGEIDMAFRSEALHECLCNACQGVLYYLAEQRRKQVQVQPAHPR